jgi:hypothetical protein
MAAYTQNIALADLSAVTQVWSNVTDKIQIDTLFSILMTEFAAAETAGLASYTVTSGLQDSLEYTLGNFANALRVEFLKDWITVIVTEFELVETNGLSYALTTSSTIALEELIDHLNRSIQYLSDSQKKIGFHSINALLRAEFVLVAAAS